uniref:Uncharacterized protein n=1 Tax=Lepeophtheirus salmonis TaxID=72036 RepID=A0A0K2TPZ7_LEPSM
MRLDKWIHPSFRFQGVPIFPFGYSIQKSFDPLFDVIFCSRDFSSLYLTRCISSSLMEGSLTVHMPLYFKICDSNF